MNSSQPFSFEPTVYNEAEKIWSGASAAADAQNLSKPFGQLLLDSLDRHGDKVVQLNHDTGIEMSAREMRLKTLRIAASLTAIGIGAGDIVQIVLSEHDNLTPLWFGIIAAGAALNPLHVSFSEHEMTHFIGLVEPKMIICESELVLTVRKGLANSSRTDQTVLYTFDSSAGLKSVDDLVRGWNDQFTYELPNVGDLKKSLALVMCTSGSTGLPKAVLVSHSMATYGLFRELPMPDGIIQFSSSSLYWISGLIMVVWSVAMRMVRVISQCASMTPASVLELLEQRKVNFFFTATSGIAPLTECLQKRPYNLSALMVVQMSGSLLSPVTRDAFRQQYKGVVFNVYGISDAACGISITLSNESAGQLFPGVQVKLIDIETGRQLGPNETGELWLKTPMDLLGYMKSANKDAIVNGWYRTGDLGYFDANRELFLVDRQKDMIKYKGYHVAPSEVENIIEKHCDIDGVVVVGIPDPEAEGMCLPTAVVVRSEANPLVSAEEIIRIVEDKLMDCKRLRGGVYFVQELPRTITGKLQRNAAQKLAVSLMENV